jgi:peptidoglycan/xylan/chitin deacetylase (PgdA/CDA1 family)
MQILLTFDYELYFGSPTGTVENCIIKPTELLMQIARKHSIPLVFFIDIGFIVRMENELNKHPVLHSSYKLICQQLDQLVREGHELQLHIHPHWEDSYFDGNEWKCNVSRYKLSDFPPTEIQRIIQSYSDRLKSFTGTTPPNTFRAGGWCVQPFGLVKTGLEQAGITIDSSVFRNGHFKSEQYAYDFRQAPDKSSWKFSADPLLEEENGRFTEIPISSRSESPFFYWKLFLLGRLNPAHYRPIGDGQAMPAPGYRKSLLTSYTTQPVSVDGYNASRLDTSLKEHSEKGLKQMVVIGHPKALSPYSLLALDQFIARQKQTHRFCGFHSF